METLTLILGTAFGTLLVFVAGWFARGWWLRQRTPTEARLEKRCDICHVELPQRSWRQGDGRWCCVSCKGKAA